MAVFVNGVLLCAQLDHWHWLWADLSTPTSRTTAHTVQAYSAMLLGFLVAEDAQLRNEAAAALPGGGLAPVANAVEQCLHFYLAVGAMPAENEQSLRRLVTSLRQQHGSDAVMVDGQP